MRVGDKVQVLRKTDERKIRAKKNARTATVVHIAERWITVDYGKYRETVWLDDVVMVLEGRKKA